MMKKRNINYPKFRKFYLFNLINFVAAVICMLLGSYNMVYTEYMTDELFNISSIIYSVIIFTLILIFAIFVVSLIIRLCTKSIQANIMYLKVSNLLYFMLALLSYVNFVPVFINQISGFTIITCIATVIYSLYFFISWRKQRKISKIIFTEARAIYHEFNAERKMIRAEIKSQKEAEKAKNAQLKQEQRLALKNSKLAEKQAKQEQIKQQKAEKLVLEQQRLREKQAKIEHKQQEKMRKKLEAANHEQEAAETTGHAHLAYSLPFKKVPFTVLCISVILLIIYLAVPALKRTDNNVILIINYFVLPIISLQFLYFGFYLKRDFQGWYKRIGLLLIFLTPVIWSLIFINYSEDKRFLTGLLYPLFPITDTPWAGLTIVQHVNLMFSDWDIVSRLTNVVNPDNGYTELMLWQFYTCSFSISVYLGLLAYWLTPKIFKFKKDSNWRYLISIFILPIITVVIFALVVYFAIKVLLTLLPEKANNSYEPTIPKDNRNYNTRVLETVRKCQFLPSEGTKVIMDMETGRQYYIYNYNPASGYLEDENNNIYYLSKYVFDNDEVYEVIQTNEYRRSDEFVYDAEQRTRNYRK